jgi:YebC/PmpR family DNA-binding regulatory protein
VSGHSKWSSIKHKKGAADARRGKLFSKLSRALIVAAREGGPDPAANLALQNAIEKARSYSMPKDNIERAIARGSGTDTDAQAFETVVYEGYAPGGVAILVEALTDNRNRTAADVRHTFAKSDGNLGEAGAVAWLFERRGVVLVDAGVDEDELTLAAAEGGADDVSLDGSSYQVVAPPETLTAVREAIEAAGIEVQSAELTMIPKTTIELEDEGAAKKVLRLIDALEENDDVQDVYANFDIPERVLEAVASSREGLAKHSLCRRAALLAPRRRPQSPPYRTATGAPCVLASERPSHPCDERRSAKPS